MYIYIADNTDSRALDTQAAFEITEPPLNFVNSRSRSPPSMSCGFTAAISCQPHMHRTLLLGALAASSLCITAVEPSAVRRVAFATTSRPSFRSTTMPPKTKKRSSSAAGLAPANRTPAGDSSCGSRTKQERRLKAEDGSAGAEAGGSTLVSCGDELVRISRRLHDKLKGATVERC